jgi:hypothetical protein
MSKPNHDYKKIDKQHKFHYYNDKLKQAKELGYDYVSEAIIELYRKHKSSSKVCQILELGGEGTIFYFLKKFGEPTNKRGGARTGQGRKHWNPLSTNTRNPESYGDDVIY